MMMTTMMMMTTTTTTTTMNEREKTEVPRKETVPFFCT